MAVVPTAGWVGPLSGKIGNVVLVKGPHGMTLRERPDRGTSRSPLQIEGEARMAKASRAFRTLTREEGQAWAAFGQTLAELHPKTGSVVSLSAQQAFNRLACKLLQIDPQASLPRTPPTSPFFGDGVRVTIGPLSDRVVFTADAANRDGVLTELLLQALASQHRRTYASRYRTQSFVHYTGTTLVAAVPCGPGWHAAAVRFVEAATGRATAQVELGLVNVG